MNEHTHPETERQRPRWARAVHNLGDDLRWAISAWCEFPRPARRLASALMMMGAAHTLGARDAVASLISVVVG